MLQKPEKGGYNQLSRRQVLKTLGYGVGAVALGVLTGCTTLVKSEPPYRFKEKFTTLNAAALDQNRLRQAVQRIKPAVKALNAWRKNGQMPTGVLAKLRIARNAALDIFAHLDEARVSKEIDAQLPTIVSKNHIKLSEEYISLIEPELQEMDFAKQDPEIRPWLFGIDLTEQVKTELLQYGVSHVWRKLSRAMEQFIATVESMMPQMCVMSASAVPLCGGGGGSSSGPGFGAYLGCGAAIFSAAAVIAILIAVCGPSIIGILLCPDLLAGAVISAGMATLGCVAAFTPD